MTNQRKFESKHNISIAKKCIWIFRLHYGDHLTHASLCLKEDSRLPDKVVWSFTPGSKLADRRVQSSSSPWSCSRLHSCSKLHHTLESSKKKQITLEYCVTKSKCIGILSHTYWIRLQYHDVFSNVFSPICVIQDDFSMHTWNHFWIQ